MWVLENAVQRGNLRSLYGGFLPVLPEDLATYMPCDATQGLPTELRLVAIRLRVE